MLSKHSVISVLPMLTVQPVVLWPIALIMIRREFNYFGVFVLGKMLWQSSSSTLEARSSNMCCSVVPALRDDCAAAIVSASWKKSHKEKWLNSDKNR